MVGGCFVTKALNQTWPSAACVPARDDYTSAPLQGGTKTVWIQRKNFPETTSRTSCASSSPWWNAGFGRWKRRWRSASPPPVCSARTSSCFSLTGFGTARAGSGSGCWSAASPRRLARSFGGHHAGFFIGATPGRLRGWCSGVIGDWAIGCLVLLSWPKRKNGRRYFRPPSIEPPSGRWPARR